MMSQFPTQISGVIFSPGADADVPMQTVFKTLFTKYNFDFRNVPSVNDTYDIIILPLHHRWRGTSARPEGVAVYYTHGPCPISEPTGQCRCVVFTAIVSSALQPSEQQTQSIPRLYHSCPEVRQHRRFYSHTHTRTHTWPNKKHPALHPNTQSQQRLWSSHSFVRFGPLNTL